MNPNSLESHLVNAVKDVPPVAVGAVTLFGVQLSDFVLILTAVYTIIRIISELHLWYARKKDDRNSTVLASRDSDGTDK